MLHYPLCEELMALQHWLPTMCNLFHVKAQYQGQEGRLCRDSKKNVDVVCAYAMLVISTSGFCSQIFGPWLIWQGVWGPTQAC